MTQEDVPQLEGDLDLLYNEIRDFYLAWGTSLGEDLARGPVDDFFKRLEELRDGQGASGEGQGVGFGEGI